MFVAVQCERKPIEVSREKSSNCAASTEKIYIRKDLRSPLAATPTFVTDSETARYSKKRKQQQHMISRWSFFVFPVKPRLKFVLICYRSAGLLDSGMFVNIHQSGIKTESTMLMTPDKVCLVQLI